MTSAEEMVRKILQARVYDVARETPLDAMPVLQHRLGQKIFLKREDLQEVFSFKLRGAYNRIARLSPEELSRGVICASAGNHAQGVALAAKRRGCRAVIVMPQTTPDIKVDSVRQRGAEVVLWGDSFDEAVRHAREIELREHQVFIHPYDDLDVMAGQGTVAMEILRQITEPVHALFIPVGGGGLIGGMAPYIKYVRPDIRVVGVEAEDSACLLAALRHGKRVTLDHVGLFADGVAVAQVGELPFAMACQYVDEVITVSVDEISAAIKDIFDDTRSIAEPSGALALAGLKKYVQQHGAQSAAMIAIDSGANINFDRLRNISERTEFAERREAVFAVAIPEKPGAFLAFCEALGKRNVTEFNYRYANDEIAHVFVGLQLRQGEREKQEVIENLLAQGYIVQDLSDDELATLHIRHLVGGHAGLADELIFRFEFPERPGALLQFLTRMGSIFNISLFHYRNHGAAFGKVLMGMQLGHHRRDDLLASLHAVGYDFQEETSNPAYRLFLR